MISKNELKKAIIENIEHDLGKETWQVTNSEMYRAVCYVTRDILAKRWVRSREAVHRQGSKQVYYLSMEFLPGTMLHNNLYNLGLDDAMKSALSELDFDIDEIYAAEPDAGLGNGGLGRLASCYLDSMATLGMSGHGMSICYEYGIFKQVIKDNRQTEAADDWLELGDCWLVTKNDESEQVYVGGQMVKAVPRDILISGYHSEMVNSLRLWQATSDADIDMELFAKGEYLKSMEEKHSAEIISKILYPADDHTEGKRLRLKQQYFMVSASMKSLIRKHLRQYDSLDNFADKIAIHINDTHPTLAILELMRLFMDEHGYGWDAAWDIVTNTVSYTNHTVMPEALERWDEELFKDLLPRLYEIIREIIRRQGPDEDRLPLIKDGEVLMADICAYASHSINGVSSLHSEIIKSDIFREYAEVHPEKFTNVTNGISYRRWLCQDNPKLTGFLSELIGPEFMRDSRALEALMEHEERKPVLEKLDLIKRSNKERLAQYVSKNNGISIDPDSIFDVQVKRLHEYKRQLLNLIHIMSLYTKIKEDASFSPVPRTFFFAAKAAGNYYIAKEIIKLACNLSEMIEKDEKARKFIKVIFLENYRVSLADIIMPAADVSEQISLAGTEASGTGNMKLMINGAVTIGTEDGANVEIHKAVGDENIFIFGMDAGEAQNLKDYSPWEYIAESPELNSVLSMMTQGINGVTFGDVAASLTTGSGSSGPDQFRVFADFADYKRAQKDLADAYIDRRRWNRMSLVNIAKSGIFSSDRAVSEYAGKIWGIEPVSR